MKSKILFILLLSSLYTIAQNKKWIDSYTTKWEKFENGTRLIVDNNNFAPITFKLEYNPINLKPDKPNETFVVVPARTKDFIVVTFNIINKKKGWKFLKGDTRVYFGDLNDTEYDKDYVYDLPFEKGSKIKVGQGYNGSTSHQGKKAIDFTMKINSKIFACRDGIVIDLMRSNFKNCAKPSCAKFNNFIKILHSDGTVMQYLHLKKNGVRVKLGQKINKGQLIGYSGNTGWSSGPHLHIELYLIDKHNKYQSLETKFRINTGEVINELKENVIYSKNY